MPVFEVKPKDLGRDLREDHARRKEAAVEAIQTAVALHGPRIAQATVATANPPPVDRGTYRRSFKAQKTPAGAVFYNFAPHAPVIEMGRRPGSRQPPLEVILAWVKRKKIGATFSGPLQSRRGGATLTGKGRVRSRELNTRRYAVDRQQRWIARMIARAIGRRGLPAHHVLAITETVLTTIVESAIADALSRL